VAKVKFVRKRDGRLVPFNERKIADAIFKAAQAVGGQDRALAEELASIVTSLLDKQFGEDGVPGIEDIQDLVEKVLIETGHARTAKAYILYRAERARIRELVQVRKRRPKSQSSTDISLLVQAGTVDEVGQWDRQRIVVALMREAGLPEAEAEVIAKAVEEKIFHSPLTRISTSLIRELVDNELFERGYDRQLAKQAVIGMPKYDLEALVYSKSKENSNIAANNPEAINLAIAETTLKQFALQEIFSQEVADAHRTGAIHIHDLGYPTRVYCSSHSLEYIKKYGLQLRNLDTSSAPAKHARTLTGHLNTYLASMQAYYAGALGVGYLNVLYAPYLEGRSFTEMKQEAQYLIFSGSQNAFSRGGQTLFLDFNVHTGVPAYIRDNPAIGPSGKPTGKTYGDYEKIAKQFTRALLEVWREGDKNGHVFAFPKCDLHISEETFEDPEQVELLRFACEAAAENGSPYFVFDRDAVTLAACCRLRTKIEDPTMVRNLESMRFCGFQNITINLPQAAYRAGRGNWPGLKEEVAKMMEIAMNAHLQKKAFIAKLMSSPEMPLWEIGKPAFDGKPYVDLQQCTYIIGLIGLNECLAYCLGKELHEDADILMKGLNLISFMNYHAKEMGKRHGLKVSLEESPAESASRRLAKIDVSIFPQAAEFVRGDLDRDEVYYTNSIHLRPDAPVDLITRIRVQSKFHTMIESGAIIHAFIGEELPPASGIYNLVEKTFRLTPAAQITISPEFTMCGKCRVQSRGIRETCPSCGSPEVYGITRIVGYYSRITNWNPSKLAELRDRRRGNYSVVNAQAWQPAPARTHA